MLEFLKSFLAHPHENGFTTFVLGVLFVLSFYHFLLYFQNKDKVYLFYSLYTFLIFINQTKFIFFEVTTEATENIYEKIMYDSHEPIVWIYNTFYFVFGFTFLNLKKYSKKWHSFIFNIVKILFITIFIIVVTVLITGNQNYIVITSKVIRSSLYLFGMIAYYSLFVVKMPLKKYIIIGSSILYISSFIGEYAEYFFSYFKNSNAASSVFYIGVIAENLVFSLGLGRKQKFILEDKNESQEKLILQLEENEKLKNIIQKQLERDVAFLNEQSKNYQLEKLKAKSEKELAELKISSLRSQMNPHFIFNSLNAIKLYIIDNNKEKAVYYLNKFSKLIRKILATTREKEITLDEEIETLKLYVDIENIRFQNQIQTSYKIDKKLRVNMIKVPSLILQPFIENAIWHGLSSKKGAKIISITFENERDKFVKIIIEDNGVGRVKSALHNKRKMHKKESIGIQLTKERLKNFSKDYHYTYTINFEDLYDDNHKAIGTFVVLRIPLI